MLAVITIGSVSALDFGKSDAVPPGSLLISGSFELGTFYPVIVGTTDSTLLGGDIAVDYALPFAALTVGASVGFSGAPVKVVLGDDPKLSLGEIPIIVRIGYHPDFGIKNLDIYALGKIGFGIGFWSGDDKDDDTTNPMGLIYGFDLGVRYFFTPSIGVFAEGGYEYAFLDYEYKSDWLGTVKTAAYHNRFVSVGVTFKLGK